MALPVSPVLTLDESIGLVLCIVENGVVTADIGKLALVHRQNTRIHIGLHTEKLSVGTNDSNKQKLSSIVLVLVQASWT